MRTMAMAVCVGLLAAGTAWSEEEREFKVYGLRAAQPETLVEAARMVVGEDGKILVDRAGTRMYVNATPAAHGRLAEMLRKADRREPNIRIDVAVSETRDVSESGVGADAGGSVVITPGGTSGSVTVRPHLKHQSSRSQQNTRQTLLLQSGTSASLFVGDVVFFRDWLVRYGRRYGYIEGTLSSREIGASLEVQATALADGKRVRVRLVPRITALEGGRTRRIALTEAATEVTATSGQPVTISEFGEHDKLYQNYLLGMSRGARDRQLSITLTPTVEDVSP